MIPLRDENPSPTPPRVTIAIIALNVAAFVYELSLGPELRPFLFEWGLVPARLALALHGQGDALLAVAPTVLTSIFLHGGWLHLVGNMWFLWIFGDNIEDRLGHARFALFYLIAGVMGSALHLAFNGTSQVPTVGASGAIAGVLGAYAAAFPRARVITLVPLFPFFQVLALPAFVMLGMWFVYQFLSGFVTSAWTPGGGGVAWWAHIGGFGFGYVTMRLFGAARARSTAWVE
jgi:membrane associated rhomboid family serine protease